MTGPEHYQEAERLLEEAEGPADHGVSALHAHIGLAQAHATLALAAATAMAGKHAHPHSGWPDGVAWYNAAGTKPATVTAGED
jgi:hypothetical protein